MLYIAGVNAILRLHLIWASGFFHMRKLSCWLVPKIADGGAPEDFFHGLRDLYSVYVTKNPIKQKKQKTFNIIYSICACYIEVSVNIIYIDYSIC